MNDLTGFVLQVVSALAFAGWLLAVAEMVGSLIFARWTFHFGLTLASAQEHVPTPPRGLSSPGFGETADVKYRVLVDGRCLYRRKFGQFQMRWNTPFEPHGSLLWDQGILRSTGRISLGGFIFIVCWATMWAAGGLFLAQEDRAGGLFVLMLGWLFVAAMYVPAWFIERRRFVSYTEQVRQALDVSPADADPVSRLTSTST